MSFDELFETYRRNIIGSMLRDLSKRLEVSEKALEAIGVGYIPKRQCWVFPERDGSGNITGLVCRGHDGKKWMVADSKRGLTYPFNIDYVQEEKRYEPGKHNWVRTSVSLLCPVCGKSDWCLLSAENPNNPEAVICPRTKEGSSKETAGGWLHIRHVSALRGRVFNPLLPSSLPTLILEGQSDVAAAFDLGFIGIGRPSAMGKLGLIDTLVKDRDVVVIGENDSGAGSDGMEAAYHHLQPLAKSAVMVLPPPTVKDLRQWKISGLTQEQLLTEIKERGRTDDKVSVFDSDSAAIIAKGFLESKFIVDDKMLLRNYRGQWVRWMNGKWEDYPIEEFRGRIYEYVEGKMFRKITAAKGGVSYDTYKPTRSKVSDVMDALNQWCTINDDPPFWIDSGDHPAPHDLVVFKNGVLDINEYIAGNVELKPVDPNYFNFVALPYDFDPESKSELWENTLSQIFSDDPAKIKLLQQWLGYNLVPDMTQEKFMVFTGQPRSGKGTIMNTMIAMVGAEQCCSTSFKDLCGGFGYQPMLGKLVALLGDARIPRENDVMQAVEKILQISGGDPVGVNRKGIRALSQVYLKVRFTVGMNDLPIMPDYSRALERRTLLLEFAQTFLGREDINLKHKLAEEARYGKLVNWALDGLKSLRLEGKFAVPDSSAALIEETAMLTNPAIAFVNECCTVDRAGVGHLCRKELVYEVWQKWCAEQGYKPGVAAIFGRQIKRAYPWIQSIRPTVSESRVWAYDGLKLTQEALTKYMNGEEI